MKSTLSALVILLICTISMLGQSNINGQIQATPTTPTGNCNRNQMKLKTPDGTVYTCQNGTWGAVTGTGGNLPAGSVVTGSDLALPGNLSVTTTVLTSNQQIDILCSGDVTTAISSAITNANANGGGTIRLSAGSCYSTAQITFPQLGTSGWQNTFRLTGQGAGPGPALGGTTVLDLRSTSADGKIYSQYRGILEIDHITFTDTTDGTADFIHIAHTQVSIHQNDFLGKHVYSVGSPTVQSGIILGVAGLMSAVYGTVIDNNVFGSLKQLVVLLDDANSVYITHNYSIFGNGDHTGAPIMVTGSGTLTVQGGEISSNLLEMPDYQDGVRVSNAQFMVITGNGCFDVDSNYRACIRLESTAVKNTIIGGLANVPAVSDAGAPVSNNSIIAWDGTQNSLTTGVVNVFNSYQAYLNLNSSYSTTGRRWALLSDQNGNFSIYDAGHLGGGGNGFVFKIDGNGVVSTAAGVSVANGANIVYRCLTTDGSHLPIGALTITAAACLSSSATSLKVD